MKVKENKGITLIVLIVTIIILLILSGISIASLTGENGILKKVSSASEQTKIEEYKEILIIIGNGLRSEKILENLSTKEYMNRYQEAIEKEIEEGALEGTTVERKNDATIKVTTKEGYVYLVTEDEVRYLGKQGENPPPSLQEGDIEFILNPNKWTNQNVNIEIKSKIEGYILQYSTDGENWEEYKEKITVSQNLTIYARLTNLLEETGGSATKEIDIIDKELPNEATITLSSTNISVGTNVIATVTQSDRGVSGVDIKNCRWVLTTSANPIGTTDSSKYTGGVFSKESQEKITLNCAKTGNYYLHVLTQDKAENRIEKISNQIAFVDKTPPNQATIVLSSTNVTVGTNINATVTQSDGQSGIDIQNCRWIFTANTNAIGTDSSKYTGGQFTKEKEQVLTINCSGSGNYYLHVLSQDKAGNKIETISNQVVVSAIETSLVITSSLPGGNPTLFKAVSGGANITFNKVNGNGWYSQDVSKNNGIRDAIYWTVDCKSTRGRVSAKSSYKVLYQGSSQQNPPGVLFVSTIRPFSGWSAEENYGGFCWYTGVPYLKSTASIRPSSTQVIEFQGVTGQIFIGFCVASSSRDGALEFDIDNLNITFY